MRHHSISTHHKHASTSSTQLSTAHPALSSAQHQHSTLPASATAPSTTHHQHQHKHMPRLAHCKAVYRELRIREEAPTRLGEPADKQPGLSFWANRLRRAETGKPNVLSIDKLLRVRGPGFYRLIKTGISTIHILEGTTRGLSFDKKKKHKGKPAVYQLIKTCDCSQACLHCSWHVGTEFLGVAQWCLLAGPRLPCTDRASAWR